jgi:oligopeptide/dipeptide ABC transporter ATP-binding protein
MADPILTAEHLSRIYHRDRSSLLDRVRGRPLPPQRVRPALLDVSFTLDRGEVLGVVGESGSGKSTLARCVTLLERPDAGRVVFDGRDLTAMGPVELRGKRRGIQIVFQDPYSSLNPRYTVQSQLAEVLTVHALAPRREIDTRVAALLDQVGLPGRARHRYPLEFSGGQRQRICIARALAAEPAVLIADEAVSALDVSIQAQILNLLLELQERLSLAMIFISHNLHVVRHVAPRVAVMFGGRIIETIPPGVPLEDAKHPYTRALVAAVPKLEVRRLESLEVPPAELAGILPTVGCPFRERCPLRFEPCETIDPPLVALVRDGSVNDHSVACHAAFEADDRFEVVSTVGQPARGVAPDSRDPMLNEETPK